MNQAWCTLDFQILGRWWQKFPASEGRLGYRLTPSLQSKNGRCGEIESLSSHRLWEHLPGRGVAVPEAPAEGTAGFGAQ